MQQNLYDQLCYWDAASGTSGATTLSQILSLYTGEQDVPSILKSIRTNKNLWLTVANNNNLSFDQMLKDVTTTMVDQNDPKINIEILSYCKDGTLTVRVEIHKDKTTGNRVYLILDWLI